VKFVRGITIIVDDSTLPDVIAAIRRYIPSRDIKRFKIICINNMPNKGRMLNYGVSKSRAEIVVFCDCDITFPWSSLQQLIQVAATEDIGYIKRVFPHGSKSSNKSSIYVRSIVECLLPDGRKGRVERSRSYPLIRARSGPGLMALRRKLFIEAQGFNGQLDGWGWEDVDLQLRCQFVQNVSVRGVGHAFHTSSQKEASPVKRLASENNNVLKSLSGILAGSFIGTFLEDRHAPGEVVTGLAMRNEVATRSCSLTDKGD
jgi:hypothetical protein